MGFIVSFLLLLIKFQNLLIFIISYFISILLYYKMKKKYLFLGAIALLVVYFMFSDFFTVEKINFYRRAFYN